MFMTTSYPISKSLFLASVPVPKGSSAPKKPEPQPTNHIVIIDCSGSMYSDLPRIREQLKGKLPILLGEKDTVSIIWFSSRGEFGTLVKGEPVATLADLNDVNKAIDRWLRPVGLTGFKEPLVEAERLVDELGGVCSVFFMSDGYDNQWSRQQILAATQSLAPKCASMTFVEYGYYANHPLLVEMAELAGGTLIFSEDFKRYEPTFDAAMQKKVFGAKKIEVDLKGDPIRGFAYALDGGNLMTFKVEGSAIKVPEHLDEVFFLSPSSVGKQAKVDGKDFATIDAAYAAIALFGQRVDSEVVLPLLKATGDVRFIKQFSGCFGKQKYSAFTDAATEAAFDKKLRLQDGYDPKAVPDDDAFTVLDLLRILAQDDGNFLLIDSKDFVYSKIGRGREQSDELTPEDQEKVEELEKQIFDAEGNTRKINKLQKEIDAIKAASKPLKFVPEPMPNGVSISNLIWNETRPNVSIQVKRDGTVDISARKPKEFKKVPNEFPTFTYRNYAIIRDGLLNVEKLPLRLTGATVRKLREAGLPDEAILGVEGEDASKAVTRAKKAADDREVSLAIKLSAIPIINRSMVKQISAEELFKTQYQLQSARAAQKVYNSVFKEEFEGRTSEGYTVLYGAEAVAWLKEQGFTDYSGFSPKGKQAAAKDSYVGKELHVALKGLSTIPSLNDYKKRVASKKPLTVSQSLMRDSVLSVDQFLESDAYKTASDKKKVYKAWLESEQKAAKLKTRHLLYLMSQMRFGVIVGQTWFKEFSSLDENTLDITTPDGEVIKGTVEMKEIEVAI